jgi:hypothetical protein
VKKLTLLAVGLGVSMLAFAGDRMKPGMWEYSMKMEMPGMPMVMPPQGYQHCLSQKDVDEHKQFQSDRQKDCEISNLKQTAGSASFDMACKDGTTGHADYTFGGETMTGKTAMKMKNGQQMNMNMSAKRTGDCK